MSSIAIQAYGTKLQRGDAATPTEHFADVAEVKSMTWSMSSKIDDVTTHSTASEGAFRSFISSLIDAGTVQFAVNFVPTDTTQGASGGILEDFTNRTKRNYQLVFPDSATTPTTWQFAGIIQDFKPSAPVDGVLEASVTIKLTGAPTFA